MAAVRDSDIALWLHNKLGTSADTWSEGSICSQLNIDVLKKIKQCFIELQTQVKLKLMLSFLHIPKRNVEEWKEELSHIIDIAINDSEPWVAMLAELMKTYPTTGSLSLDIREPAENQKIIYDLVVEMKKLVKKHSELGLLPLECNYLNRNAFLAAACQQVPMTKHFALRRKSKAAALRVELIGRSSDCQANIKKNQLPAVPVRSRGIRRKSDTMPMRGIPNKVLPSNLRNSSFTTTPMSRPIGRSTNLNRKDGGIKLLEISESPIAAQQTKKRRRIQEISEAKAAAESEKQKEVVPEKVVPPPTPTTSSPHKQQQHQQEPATPDYAAGLALSNPPTPSPATPVPILAVAASPTNLHGNPVALTVRSPTAAISQATRVKVEGGAPVQTTLQPQRILVATSQPGSGGAPQTILYRSVQPTAGAYNAADLVQATLVTNTQEIATPTGQAQYATLQPVQSDLIYATDVNLSSPNPGQVQQIISVTPAAAGTTQTVQVTPQAQPRPVTQVQTKKPQLSLTKEQMMEAQEMFRTSNKVTRPEKALILGFMAGSRDNPCPHLGNIVTIKLSEREELVGQPGGATANMLAETHFQMNYSSGEWKRIRKYRPMAME